jgi:hypothetical protein
MSTTTNRLQDARRMTQSSQTTTTTAEPCLPLHQKSQHLLLPSQK